MFNAFMIHRLQKRVFKLKVTLGGVESEILGIDSVIKRTGKVTNGQADKLATLARQRGELVTAIALIEQEIGERQRMLELNPRTYHSFGEGE
jgi:hypothetical protein